MHPSVEVGSDGVLIRRFRVPSRSHPLYAALYPLAANRATASALRHLPQSTVVHSHFAMNAVAARTARRSYVQTFHNPMFKEIALERAERYKFRRSRSPPASLVSGGLSARSFGARASMSS